MSEQERSRPPEPRASEPAEAAQPLPWEGAAGSIVGRYLATLGSAFSPVRTAAAFEHGELRPALRFALLSALPMAALAGVIPYTRTLLFRGDFVIEVLGKPSSQQIALDVAQAAALQVALVLIDALCLSLPFTSLVASYAPGKQTAAARVICYRVWLLPAALLLYYVAGFGSHAPDLSLPAAEQSPPLAVTLALLLRLIAPVLLFIAMSSAARVSCRLGPLLAFVVVAVPIAVMMVVELLLGVALTGVLPPPPQPSP